MVGRKKVQAILDQKLNRKDFIKQMGLGAVAVVGVSSLVNLLTKGDTAKAVGATYTDSQFFLQDDNDTTKQAQFEVGGVSSGTTRTYTLPDFDTVLSGLTGYVTNDTAATYANQYTKIASVTYHQQYSDAHLVFVVSALDGGNPSAYATVDFYVRQQPAMGSAPDVSLRVTDSKNLKKDNFIAVATTLIAGTTTVDLYGRLTNAYEKWAFNPFLSARSDGGVTTTFYANQAFSSTLPSGTQFAAVYYDVITENAYIDTIQGWNAGSGGTAPIFPFGLTVTDSGLTIQDNADTTKKAKFELSGITTGTTRTLTVPNATGTLALVGDVEKQELYHDFTNKSNGAVASTADSGQTWTQSWNRAAAVPTISSGRYTNTDTAAGVSAGYLTAQIGSTVTWMEAELEFGSSGTTPTEAFCMAAWTTNLASGLGPTPPDSPAHVVFTEGNVQWGTFSSGVLTNIVTIPYKQTFTTQLQRIAVGLDKETGKGWVLCPDGVLYEVAHSSISSMTVPYVTFETFHNNANTDRRINIRKVGADSRAMSSPTAERLTKAQALRQAASSASNMLVEDSKLMLHDGLTKFANFELAGITAGQVRTYALPDASVPLTGKYTGTVGDGSSTSITVTHNLNTRDVSVTAYSASSTYDEYNPTVRHTSTTQVTLIFAVAPAANSVRVVVIG